MGVSPFFAVAVFSPGLVALSVFLCTRRQGVAIPRRAVNCSLLLCALAAVLPAFAVVAVVVTESLRFFLHIPQPGESSAVFDLLPILGSTARITGLALIVALPPALLTAVALSEFTAVKHRALFKAMLELFAAIPTVVYGFFALVAIVPLLVRIAISLSVPVSNIAPATAGIVIGFMLLPGLVARADDAIQAVPAGLRAGSTALGATDVETILHVVLPAALPGLAASLLLALSRAAGETVIVLMIAGFAYPASNAILPLTVQLVTSAGGTAPPDSATVSAAFAAGLLLLLVTAAAGIAADRLLKQSGMPAGREI